MGCPLRARDVEQHDQCTIGLSGESGMSAVGDANATADLDAVSADGAADAAADLDAVAVFLRESGHEDAAGPPRAQDTSDATVKLGAVVSFLRVNGYGAAADLVRATFPWRRLGAYVGDMMRRMPPDTLAYVASWATRGDLLALRAAFAAGRDAARRAVPSHPDCHEFEFAFEGSGVSALAIKAIGRVFGGGCRRLKWGVHGSPAIASLQSFVTNTNQKLEELTLWNIPLSLEVLREVCRACPRLAKLNLRFCATLRISAGVVEIASSLASICPMISDVDLPSGPRGTARGAAELWAMHFPNLKVLRFGTGYVDYRPELFDQIRETVAKCSLATEVDLCACLVHPDLIEYLVRSPLGTRLTRLVLADSQISPLTILAAARGFQKLRDLELPDVVNCDAGFFQLLYQVRPEIAQLHVGCESDIEDAGVKYLCNKFRLEVLRFALNRNLTVGVIDAILDSTSSKTLQEVEFDYTCCSLEGSEFLSLADGCPSLKKMTWNLDTNKYRATQATGLRRLSDLLRSRGGQLATDIPKEDWR